MNAGRRRFEGGHRRQARWCGQPQQRVADPRHAPEEPGVEDAVFEPVGGEAEVPRFAGPGDDDPRQPARALDGLAPHQAAAGREERFAAAHVAAAQVIGHVRRGAGGGLERGFELVEQLGVDGVGAAERDRQRHPGRAVAPGGHRRAEAGDPFHGLPEHRPVLRAVDVP
jgi:hypothetical protein